MPAASDIIQFFRGQVLETPTLPTRSLVGQTIVITGANTGLGLQCAKQCAQLGAAVIVLGCRNLTKGEVARQEVGAACKASKAEVLLWHIDMLDFVSVKAFAERMKTNLARVDAVVANAGIDVLQFKLAEGFESTLTVNVISTFLLAILVRPQLEQTANKFKQPSHIAIVGSNVHCFADHSQLQEMQPNSIFKALSDQTQAKMPSRYFLSKLIVMLCAREMAQASAGKDGTRPSVIMNCPSPGWCKTELFREDDGGFWGRNMLRLIGRTAEVGARNLTSAIMADASSQGQYFSECRVKPPSVWVRSPEGYSLQQKLWSELESIIQVEVARA